ncbi:eukaryotic aspartyl protease family protein [Striga asiatica]|uniref:Eukaryotic aspartyl protease family protein n=1 Tax=Striga asiatica TaxID=4170 RepID=A0A5A7P999_STRAF|nr:eukaryotic aspartyl protease family protein [Striga asiatica]
MMATSSKARATIYAHPKNETLSANKIQLPVQNKGLQYSVKIKIGSPSIEVTLLLDTGCGDIWTHCKKLTFLRFSERNGFFPKRSKTYKELPCHHPMCEKSKEYQSPVFSGILGMDKLPSSLISRVRENVKGRYSYCLHQGNGLLRFGDDIPQVTKDYKTTKILDPSYNGMYVDLTDISVAGKQLGLSPSMFSHANGGFIIDTGTQFTVLKRQAYDKVIKAFVDYYANRLKRVQMREWDLCYKHNSSMRSYASMTFHLQGADYVTSDLFVNLKGGVINCSSSHSHLFIYCSIPELWLHSRISTSQRLVQSNHIHYLQMNMSRCIRNIYLVHLLLAFFHCNTPPAADGLKLKLIPWDSPESPLYPGNLTTLQKHQRAIRFSNHLQTLSLYSPNTKPDQTKLQIPVHSHSFRYSVNLRIGTPSKEVNLLFDTGSAFVWTQCDPKSNTYNPSTSKTYKPLPCNHRLCAKKICKCVKNQCVCTIPYGSSGMKYKLAYSLDTFHLPQSKTPFPGIAFGCSTKQPLSFSGILGLDRTPVSLLAQVRDQIGGQFSYCLHNGPSFLTLGKDAQISDAKHVKTTPLVHTDFSTLLLNLTDISVAGKRIGLSPTLFSLKNGGVFMDTGMRYTVLAKAAYDKVSKAFANYFKGKLKKLSESHFDMEPCYQMTPGFKNFPTMTFHFEGAAADMVVDYTHVSDGSVACTAVARGGRTIIGALQQWNTRIVFDIDKNVMKFQRADCAKDGK